MTNFDVLKESTKKLLPTGLDPDLTADYHDNILFLTHVFKDGCLLGFWTHSPWGCCHDKEQGWAVLDNNLQVLSDCETRTMGLPAGNNFKEWRFLQKQIHGKAFKLCPEWENSSFWKIKE